MKTVLKSVTAVAVAVTIATGALAASAEARSYGGHFAVGAPIELAAAFGVNDQLAYSTRKQQKKKADPCAWLKRKALQTGSQYWWTRYRDCRGW